MLLGVAYYPEHWPHEQWETDARLMAEAGITRVRMGEFAWHRLEPVDGQFDFGWLKEAIDLLGRFGIDTIVGTPTPTYPAWLHAKYPDVHQIKSNGIVKEFGQRQDACKNHLGYRAYARRIVEQMTAALGNHPHVVAWQTDNEFGCHDTARCYCDLCRAAFQAWLRERFHDDVASLNAAWGTFFWSQTYNSFDEIQPPHDTADQTGNNGQNPGLVVDFYRFSSDVQVRFHKEQAEIIRRNSPGRLITHNLMGLFPHIDYYDLAAELDVVSWDNYPFHMNGTNQPPQPLPHDLMRGLKQQNVWVMEQGSGAGGWGSYPATPRPGQMRLWAYQAVARGADMISFFRWRSCRYGREQYWHGILYHHGIPQRRYDEAQQIGGEFKALSPELDGTTVVSDIGILYDYNSLWALETQPNTGDGFNYMEMASRWDKALARLGVTADAVRIDSDLSRYKVLIAPTVHVCPPATAARLTAYVQDGGTLILGPRSGVKEEEGAIVDALLPGLLAELAGCYVEEYDAFNAVAGLTMHVRDAGGSRYRAHGLADVLLSQGAAEPVLWYDDHYYAGRPAAVRNATGAGACTYLGTVLDDAGLHALLTRTLAETGIATREDLPESIETTCRAGRAGRFRFYLNHADQPVAVKLYAPGVDLLTGWAVAGSVEVPGFGVIIVKEE
jgi:beta-galactosidase